MHQAGEAAPGRPVTGETMFALASVSKPLTAAAVMRVIDQGIFSLDDDVASILPQFGQPDDPFAEDALSILEAQRDSVTFRQLLAHTSGAPENAGIKRIRPSTLPSLDEQVKVMMQVPLQSAPGEVLRYSNIGPAIAAHAAEVAVGIPFHQLLQHTVLDEMGLTDIVLTPDPSLDDRIALVQDPSNEGTPAESYNSRYWRDMGIPWGGYFGTPSDILRFATSFLPDRDIPLSADCVSAMTTDQVHGLEGGVESLGAIWRPGFWGAGWEVKGTKRRHWTGEKSDASTWCHWGQAGTLVWVDPTRELGVAIFANRTVRKPWPLRPPRWLELSDAIIDVADAKG
jgi:beta-lactamase class C